jgi:2-dehydropantoate 2-reductase
MAGGPKIAVLGAGSVGCFVGGAWQAAGLSVAFVGRSSIAREVDEHGLVLTDFTGWRTEIKPGDVDYRCGPEALDEAEVILLCVKSGDTAEAAAQIAEHAREAATVVSFQNGVSNIDVLERGLGGRFEIARGMVPFNIAHLGEGRFHKGVAGNLYAARRPATVALADAVKAGPASLTLSDDMLALAWGKLLINLNNAVNALSGRTLIEQLGERDYRRVFAASMQEGLKLLRRAEIEPAKVGPAPPAMLPHIIASPDWLFENLFLKSWKIDATARSSMADDLAAGRKTEVDYLNGELVALADRLHAEAPVNRAILDLVRKAEAGAKPLAPAALRLAALGG